MTTFNRFHKLSVKLAIIIALSAPSLTLNTQKTMAFDLKPVLNRIGRGVVESVFGTNQQPPNSQQSNQPTPSPSSQPTNSQPSNQPTPSPSPQPSNQPKPR